MFVAATRRRDDIAAAAADVTLPLFFFSARCFFFAMPAIFRRVFADIFLRRALCRRYAFLRHAVIFKNACATARSTHAIAYTRHTILPAFCHATPCHYATCQLSLHDGRHAIKSRRVDTDIAAAPRLRKRWRDYEVALLTRYAAESSANTPLYYVTSIRRRLRVCHDYALRLRAMLLRHTIFFSHAMRRCDGARVCC